MKITKKDLDAKLMETQHSTRLEVIREVKTFNENYLEKEVLNLYLNDLQSHYIFEYRKVEK